MNLVDVYDMVNFWCGFEAISISFTFICGEKRYSSHSPQIKIEVNMISHVVINKMTSA
jgi:hypothetical protein